MVWQRENKFVYEVFTKKHKIILVFFLLLFICLSIRLFYLQILNGNDYRIVSEQQRMHNTYERAPRGIIYSANNEILAENKSTYVVLFHPYNKCQSPSIQVIKELSKILDREIKPYTDKSLKYGKYIKLADNLTIEELFKIQEKKLMLEGISVTKVPRRIYHFAKETSHITGYISEIRAEELEDLLGQGYKLGDYIGRGGIEQFYDSYLKGINGGWQIEVNARGYQMKTFKYIAPKTGDSVYSTIDLNLQKIAYNALKDSSTGKGAVVVIDVKTGAVKALVSCPGFNANRAGYKDFSRYLKNKKLPLFNRALQALYPPGSIFKIVIFAAAIDVLGTDSLETTQCTGSFKVGNRHYACWLKSGHGRLNIISAMALSCNVYFYQLGLKLGMKNLEKYTKKFYFGQKTNLDLPNEKSGFIPSPEWKKLKLKMSWLKGDTAIFAIGQGALSVTPLQMAYTMSVIANNGFCHKPYIVSKIVNFDGIEVYKHELKVVNKLELEDKTWLLLHKALLETIENGTGRKCKIDGIKIAGKTGTAQNPPLKDHAWFVSYAPADNPEIALAVIVENGGSGGLNAVPIGRKIYETYFNIRK
ncbi:MAG: penicillin-binding protein 2 [Endomicrobium sp.]|nr:penicillin-binding protein 2 [Endomicrobium sp.]